MSAQKTFIVVAGNIGAGKTTLTQMLSKKFGWQPHFEAVTNNPYLEDFYSDKSRWSFPLQIFFLNNRFRSHQRIMLGTDSAIQDRSIYEDANIFARTLFEAGDMQERDYKNYLEIYQTMCSVLTVPDLVVYVRKSVPKLREWIRHRGRDYEQSISSEYLENLNKNYDEWMAGYSLGRKLIIESDHLDYVRNQDDFNAVANKILETLPQRDLFIESRL